MNIKNKTVLVTGGAGFIGSHTVDALIKKGARVIIVDNLSTGRKENLNPAYFSKKSGADPKAKFYKLNIADPKIEMIIKKEKPEIIYHFAFFVLVPKSVENPLLDMDCLIGSIRILRAIQKLKNFKKFIFASSGFLYGNNPNLPTKETELMDPVSPYVVTKNSIENYLRFFHNAHGLPYVILRYSTVYGPRQVKGAMADYIRKLSQGKQAEIWGDGTKTRDYVYIDDVTRANLLALDVNNHHPDPIFNVGTGKETMLRNLYQKIADFLNKEAKPIYYPDRLAEIIRFVLDVSKIEKELRCKPTTSLNQGLIKLLKSWHLL